MSGPKWWITLDPEIYGAIINADGVIKYPGLYRTTPKVNDEDLRG